MKCGLDICANRFTNFSAERITTCMVQAVGWPEELKEKKWPAACSIMCATGNICGRGSGRDAGGRSWWRFVPACEQQETKPAARALRTAAHIIISVPSLPWKVSRPWRVTFVARFAFQTLPWHASSSLIDLACHAAQLSIYSMPAINKRPPFFRKKVYRKL